MSALSEAVLRLIRATGYGSGVLHAEWILADGGPYLVECAARMPGDNIKDLIDLAYGGDLIADDVRVLEGSDPGRPPDPKRGAAIRFLSQGSGVVTEVTGLDLVAAAADVQEAIVTAEVGGRLQIPTNSWQRAGHVMVDRRGRSPGCRAGGRPGQADPDRRPGGPVITRLQTWGVAESPAGAVPPAGRLFVLLTFVDAIGTGMFMAGAVIFFVRSIGLTNNEVGTGLAIAGLVGLVTSVPMGSAPGDHIGAKRMMVIMQYWRAACFLALAICTNSCSS